MELPQAAGWEPASWRSWLFGPERLQGAAVVCPSGHAFSIGGGRPFGSVHSIDAQGNVQPSVVCPDCDWHVMVRLQGWPPDTSAESAAR
jgi:hypothetical protein